jgi:hypothetical protein
MRRGTGGKEKICQKQTLILMLPIICSRFSFDHQLLVAAAAILISYIIPGHLLRKQYQHQ